MNSATHARIPVVPAEVAGRTTTVPTHPMARTIGSTDVADVSGQRKPRLTWSAVRAPFELLLLVWSVPVIMMLVITPIGLVLAGAVWAVRMVVGP